MKRLPIFINHFAALLFVLCLASSGILVAKAVSPTQGQPPKQIVREVRHELLMLPYYSVFDWLEYSVSPNGDVTLSGQVTRPVTKSDAVAAVKGIEGVGRVVDNIQVLPLSPNDDRLRLAVYRAIYGSDSPLFRYAVGSLNTIHIIVSNGRVTLKGYVDNEGDRNIANVRANTVPGVLSVQNDLQVVNRPAR